MRDTSALAVSTQHQLRLGALSNSLLCEGDHVCGTGVIAAGEVAGGVGGVVHALGGDVVGAEGGFEGRDEFGPDDGADVAGFGGAAGEDECDRWRGAVSMGCDEEGKWMRG